MDAAATAPAAIIGLAFLGDQIWPGRQWLAGIGFILTLVAVVGMSRFAQPQQTTASYEGRHTDGRPVPAVLLAPALEPPATLALWNADTEALNLPHVLPMNPGNGRHPKSPSNAPAVYGNVGN